MRSRLSLRSVVLFSALTALLPFVPCRAAEPAPAAAAAAKKNLLPDDVEEAWKAVLKAQRPPKPPAEWNEKQPSEADIDAFKKQMATAAGKAADLAHEFQDRWPKDERAAEAKTAERNLLNAAVQLGDESRVAALKAAGGAPRPEPAADAGPKDELRSKLQQAAQAAMAKSEKDGIAAVLVEFEKGIRALQKDYPDRPEIYGALLECAQGMEGEKALALAREIEAAKTEPELKQMAGKLRKKLEMIGKPLTLAFTAVDGRKVDLAELRGKVVLVDFWATWCGPCVAELPNVKAAYGKLHDQGFEILGISFDEDKDKLTGFVKQKGMAWPQFFDGEGWKNKYGQEFGINSIPSMWLVDKQGNLRDLNAREGLAEKVEKLLAEK